MDVTTWLIVLVVMVVIELITMGLTTIWFAGGALAAALVALVNGPVWLQIIVFLVVSIALLFVTRPIAMKYFNKDRARTNVEAMIGQQAIVISEINNLQGIGQVSVSGVEWSARSDDQEVAIPVGAVVEVTGVSGVKLIVKEKER